MNFVSQGIIFIGDLKYMKFTQAFGIAAIVVILGIGILWWYTVRQGHEITSGENNKREMPVSDTTQRQAEKDKRGQ